MGLGVGLASTLDVTVELEVMIGLGVGESWRPMYPAAMRIPPKAVIRAAIAVINPGSVVQNEGPGFP